MKTSILPALRAPLVLMGMLVVMSCFPFPSWAKEAQDMTPVSWHEGRTQHQAYMAQDEIAVFWRLGAGGAGQISSLPQLPANTTLLESNEARSFLSMKADAEPSRVQADVRVLQQHPSVTALSPVFYPGPDRDQSQRMALTGRIVLGFKSSAGFEDRRRIEKDYGLRSARTFDVEGGAAIYVAAGLPLDVLETANRIWEKESGLLSYAYPEWLRPRFPRTVEPDPLYPVQWHLLNTGQGGGTPGADVDIEGAWIKGFGSHEQVIAIVDDGLEVSHPDLQANTLPGGHWDFVANDTDPSPAYGDAHGTACAGVAAARKDNGLGGTGAAPEARLIGLRLLGAETDEHEALAFSWQPDVVDISSNSWGPSDNGQTLGGPGPLARDALKAAAQDHNTVFVWAGGNGALDEDNANYDGYANSRFTIAVAATTNQGDQSYYSEPGACLLVNAPSSGGTLAITTTDLQGNAGDSSGDYTDQFGGTSSACPLAAGVAALMLEANPALSFRDVQYILAVTAEQNDPGHGDWTLNGAGYPINHWYGFGRVDAREAVLKAASWDLLPPEILVEKVRNPGLVIADEDPVGVSDTITVSRNMEVEFVEVEFTSADHTYWGDLRIELTSPAGTVSVLAEEHYSSNRYIFDHWRFGSVRHLGESARGEWTLRVADLVPKDVGTFQEWTLRLYGHRTAPVMTPIFKLLLH